MLRKQFFLLLALHLAFVKLPAQLCQGSLGDPIVNITFGAGTNPGPPLTSTHNLQYTPGSCPNDGFYTVANQGISCFNNTWHSIKSDHTGDKNGFFMLINASLRRSEFYRDTVQGLCPATTYEFAAWIMNVLTPDACYGNGIKPNLTFTIERTDGTILQSYNTGDINSTPNPLWVQNGFYFTTPSDVSDIVLRIINTSIGGCGNDLALDDITFRPCGAKLTASVNGSANTVQELCVGDSKDIKLSCVVSAGYNNPSFQWQQSRDGDSWTNISGATGTSISRNFPSSTPAGLYYYRLTVAEASNLYIPSCRVASDPIMVRVNNRPVTEISANTNGCQGSPLILSASGGTNYLWTGPKSFSASGSPVQINNAELDEAGKYYVTVVSNVGCITNDSTIVSVNPRPVATTGFSSKIICVGDSVQLTASGGTTYQWFPSDGLSSSVVANPVAKPATPIIYSVMVGNDFSCFDSVSVSINTVEQPVANAGPDKVIIQGQSAQINGSDIGGGVSISWSPEMYLNDPHILTPVTNPKADISYTLTVQSNYGCGTSSDSMKIKVYKQVIVPNAFSPNGDGINDTWIITALTAYENFDLSVFNRFGTIVYKTRDYSNPWNGNFQGKPLPIGTYYYVIKLNDILPILKGYVVILR